MVASYTSVYAIALNSAGRSQEALAALNDNLARHPNDRDTLMALIGISRNNQDPVSALGYAERLARLVPNDRSIAQLIDDLRRQVARARDK